MSPNVIIILLAIASGLTSLAGVVFAFFFERRVRCIVAGMGFSTGLMLMISVFELIPESLLASGLSMTLGITFAGAIFLGVLDYVIPHTELIRAKGRLNGYLVKAAYLVAFGLMLHDIPEGFAMASSYAYRAGLGLFIAISIAAHNFAEGFAMAIPLVITQEKSFLVKLALMSALAEPFGAVLGIAAASLVPGLTPLMMAFAAGAMIYVSVHELMPLAQRYGRIWVFLVGMGFSVVIYLLMHSVFF